MPSLPSEDETLDGITDSTDRSLSKDQESEGQGSLAAGQSMGSQRAGLG